MPKRTISEAQQVLDQLLLSPTDRRDKEEEVQSARLRFQSRLEQDLDQRHASLKDQIEDLEAGLIAVGRRLHALGQEADSLTAREYRARYDKAMERKTKLLRRAEELDHAVKRVRREERHPDRAIDQMLEQCPMLKPRFSF